MSSDSEPATPDAAKNEPYNWKQDAAAFSIEGSRRSPTTAASDDLTPEVLAWWEELISGAEFVATSALGKLRNIPVSPENVLALVSGVQSRDARIVELEAEVAARNAVIEAVAKEMRRGGLGPMDVPVDVTKQADMQAMVEAVVLRSERVRGLLSTAPSSVLSARDAEKWDEGAIAHDNSSSIFLSDCLAKNPYRAGAEHD